MEKLPSQSEFDDQTEPHVDMSERSVNKIAQVLYETYAETGINISDWIACLNEYLAEHFENFTPMGVLTHITDKIIRGDKSIPLDHIPYDNQQELIREVAEWLAAEQICEQMVGYEREIENGIRDGRFKEILDIKEISVIKDHEVFHGRKKERATQGQKEEIGRNIQGHYVIKIEPKLGSGARVNVLELVPRRIPMPIPRRDELKEGLMLQSPNKFLVIRILRDSYKLILGGDVESSEKHAIDIFLKANKHLVFQASDHNVDSIISSSVVQVDLVLTQEEPDQPDLSEQPEQSKETKPGIHSFIPPLVIIKAKFSEQDDYEYATIQKKVNARGELRRGDRGFCTDVRDYPYFRQKVRQFLSAVKKFYKVTGHTPDTVGRGNVLYTHKGNIYLVDINNIVSAPDSYLLALIAHHRNLKCGIEAGYFKEMQDFIMQELQKTEKEIMEMLSAQEKYKKFIPDFFEKIADKIHSNKNSKPVYDFLRATKMTDDIGEPIFFHNIDNLLRVEEEILKADFEDGIITEEEFKLRMAKVREEPLYRILNPNRGVWKNKRGFSMKDYIENKAQGHDNWISYYMEHLYSSVASSNEL